MEYLKELAKYVAVTVTSCGISYFITFHLNCDGLMGLLLYAVVAVSVPSSMYMILFRKNEHFSDTIQFARRLLPVTNKAE